MKEIHYKGEGQRLDMYVSGLLNISRSQAQKRIKSGEIKVGGKIVSPSKKIVQGDIITISKPKVKSQERVIPKIKIVFEDENIIVVDKQAGIVVYPDGHHKSGTMLDVLRDKIEIQGEERPGVVHRLDKDTSGLIVFAKNEKTEKELKKNIKNREFEKIYLALVWGKVEPKKGRIEIPIKRAEKDRKKMEAAHSGRESRTEYEVMEYYKFSHPRGVKQNTPLGCENLTLLKVKIITGRTHQIRVHFSGIGFPVVGDKTYGPRSLSFPQRRESSRQFLHAHELGFELYGKKYHFKSDLPEDLANFLKGIKK